MSLISQKVDTPTFLIGLAGGFAFVSLFAYRVVAASGTYQALGMLLLALGGWAIGWVARKFSNRWKQGVAVAGVVAIWYLAFALLGTWKPGVFGQ